MAATVIAVPSPITKVAATPAQNRPCASANTSTMIAPEHGRRPTATIAERPRCQPPGPASSSGSGPCGVAPGRGMLVMVVVMIVVMMAVTVVIDGHDGRDRDRGRDACDRAAASPRRRPRAAAGCRPRASRRKPLPLTQISRAPTSAISA